MQCVAERPCGQVQRVWSLLADHRVDLGLVIDDPHAAQLAKIGIVQLTAVGADDQSVVAVDPVDIGVGVGVDRGEVGPARHAVVYEDGRSVGGQDQPLPSTVWLVEFAAEKAVHELLGSGVSQHPGIKHLHMTNPRGRQRARERGSVALDVG